MAIDFNRDDCFLNGEHSNGVQLCLVSGNPMLNRQRKWCMCAVFRGGDYRIRTLAVFDGKSLIAGCGALGHFPFRDIFALEDLYFE